MKIFITVLALVCITVSAQADQKAVNEAQCEAKCQHDASLAATACKEVVECVDYVSYQYRSCIKSCDAE